MFNFPINVDQHGRPGIGIGGPGGIAVDLETKRVGAARVGIAIFPDDGIRRVGAPPPVKTAETASRIAAVREEADLKSALRLIRAMPELQGGPSLILERTERDLNRSIVAEGGQLHLYLGDAAARINVDKLSWLTLRIGDVVMSDVERYLPELTASELAAGLERLFARG